MRRPAPLSLAEQEREEATRALEELESDIEIEESAGKKVQEEAVMVNPILNKKICDICGKLFHKKSLKKHKTREHLSQKYACEVCGVIVSSSHNLVRHFKKVHEQVGKEEQCETCGRKFKSLSSLNYHITRVHSDMVNNRVGCGKCDKLFTTKRHLNRHMRKVHNKK
jgi:hypothetical protein